MSPDAVAQRSRRFAKALAERDDLHRVAQVSGDHGEMIAWAPRRLPVEALVSPEFTFEDHPFAVQVRGESAGASRYEPAMPFDAGWQMRRLLKDGSSELVTRPMFEPHHRPPTHDFVVEILPPLLREGFVDFTSLVALFRNTLPAAQRRPGTYSVEVGPCRCVTSSEALVLEPIRFSVELEDGASGRLEGW